MKIVTVCRFVTAFTLSLLFLGIGEAPCAPVETSLNLNRPMVLRGQSQFVYALINFRVTDVVPDAEQNREPLDFSLVIDRSGSMRQKGKLKYAKAAAKKLLGLLTSEDSLSIVEYDNRVGVPWPQSSVAQRYRIENIINGLTPRGGTNLSGGLMEGFHQVARFGRRNAVRRVVLLSDGLANQGETDPHRISDMALSARNRGVGVTTMGVGLDYDEDLMQSIAESGGGKYYYIEDPCQVAEFFEQEIGVLFNMVTKGVMLEIVPGEHVKNVEVLGYTTRREGNNLLVSMGDFYFGENRSMLIRLDLDGLEADRAVLGKVKLQYTDSADGREITTPMEIAVQTTPHAELVEERENRDVSVESILVAADQEHEDFIRLYEQGRVADAKDRLENLSAKLERELAKYQNVKISKKIEALKMEDQEIDRAQCDLSYRKNYLKKSKQAFYLSKKGKRGKYILMEGSRGYDVLRLQEALAGKGFYQGPKNGRYTPETSEALSRYQKANNLEPDGVAGPFTLRSLGLY